MNKPEQRKPQLTRKLRSLFVWHRWMGASAALFLFLLAVTGIGLNHADTLKLERRHIGWSPILALYRVPAPRNITSFTVDGHQLALVEERLYLDRQLVSRPHRELHGLVTWRGFLLAAVDDALLLLEPGSNRIDRIGPEAGLPLQIDGLGLANDGLPVIRSSQGLFRPDDQLLQWTPLRPVSGISFSRPAALSAGDTEALQLRYRQQVLDWERVLLDLHSGRLFGLGPLLMDLVAVITILLALSGPLLWWRQARKSRTRHR